MSFIEEIKKRAKEDIKTIVLPEANDIRTLEATQIILNEKFAKPLLIGNKEEVLELAKTKDLNIKEVEIIDPSKSSEYDEYVQQFYELRKAKGMTLEKAKEIILDSVYFGMMMVKLRKSRWASFRSSTFYSRYTSTSTTNTKNSTRYKTCFCLFCNVCTKLRIW